MSDATGAREVTEGGLLDGKIRYRQFASGHRTGFEPVLLAASIAIRPGERVLEAGCGAGAALLCLGHRMPSLTGRGVEVDPELANLSNENFKINELDDVSCICSQVESLKLSGGFDHAMANPPWFGQRNTQSPDRLRALAHHAGPSLLRNWVRTLSASLEPRGSLTLILPSPSLKEAAAAFRANGFGATALFPLWPRAGRPAKIIILTARLGASGPDRVLPGLILHDQTGITAAAQAVLRDGEAIDLGG